MMCCKPEDSEAMLTSMTRIKKLHYKTYNLIIHQLGTSTPLNRRLQKLSSLTIISQETRGQAVTRGVPKRRPLPACFLLRRLLLNRSFKSPLFYFDSFISPWESRALWGLREFSLLCGTHFLSMMLVGIKCDWNSVPLNLSDQILNLYVRNQSSLWHLNEKHKPSK